MNLDLVAFIFGVIALTYMVVVNGSYLLITGVAVRQLRRQVAIDQYDPVGSIQSNHFLPGIAVVVPAYNEAPVIVDSVKSLLALHYPNQDVIVVNDGSTDRTLDRLRTEFDLRRVEADYPVDLQCEPVHDIYRGTNEHLVVIDKNNGGKADALNAGLFFTDKPLFCAIDADSIIERGGLMAVVEPFLTNPEQTVATGGSIRIANGCSFHNGALQSVSLPKSHIVRFQVVEYLRAFLLGRIGLSNLNSLLIISGAFGLFDTETLRTIDGYDTESITEDMELMVRLQCHLEETGVDNAVHFLPQPVAWTEAPTARSALSSQRRRWFRGLLDTLVTHRKAIGRPSYGMIGVFALPFFLFVEALGPLVEGAGYILIPLLILTGLLNAQFFLLFLFVAVGLSAVLSAFAIFGEVITYRRYERPQEVLLLLIYGSLESFLYRPWRAFVHWRGLFDYLRGDRDWGEMKRSGFKEDEQTDERDEDITGDEDVGTANSEIGDGHERDRDV